MSRFFHHALFEKVIYFEWVLLALCVAGETVAWRFAPPDPSAPSLLVSLVIIAIVAVLSFFSPVEGSDWDKLCFLFLEIVLLTGAAASGLPRFVFPLFMVVIAKACLILDRRGVFVIGSLAFSAQIVYASYKLIITRPQLVMDGVRLESVLILLGGALILTYGAIMLMILVAILTLALVAEQKMRKETERLSKEVETLATELERTRIAREIHDSLGHTLTSLNIQLDVARRFAQVDSEKAAEALELAKELASQSLKDVRMAVQSIQNPDFNLPDEVAALVSALKQGQALDIDCRMDLPELPPSTSYQLFRVVQECLTNVLKHAQASRVTLCLEKSPEGVKLQVADDGRGLDPEADGRGFGIKGIRERVESMRGTVAITTEPNQGTEIRVVIPL